MVRGLTIQETNTDQFRVFGFQKQFRIDIKKSFEDKVGQKEVTAKVALRALKLIQFKSKALAILSKPIVLAAGALTALAVGITLGVLSGGGLPVAALVAMKVAGVAFTMTGTFLGFFSLRKFFDFKWGDMTHAYENQAKEAKHYIHQINQKLKNNSDFFDNNDFFVGT